MDVLNEEILEAVKQMNPVTHGPDGIEAILYIKS